MFIAVVGCGHGEVDKIYEVIESIEKQRQIKVDIVLCCGDFQSVRNMTDLRCMACPIKYQQMHDFYRYYSGEKKASVLTLFIGGNHEASNFLQELPYGGWVAPNIFYMGYTGVFRYGSVRIAGVSGIYKGNDYLKGRYEAPPYNDNSMRSVYHYRNLDILRLKQLKGAVDVMLSHDWPKGIYNYGNVNGLLRRKPFFLQEIQSDSLGSRPLFEVMAKIHPTYWFSAHMHVKFAAIFNSDDDTGESVPPTEGQTSSQTKTEDDNESRTSVKENKTTKFLALDKILPKRQFLQIIEVPSDVPAESLKLEYDAEWLAILNLTNHLVSSKNSTCFMPGPGYNSRYDFTPTKEEVDDVLKRFDGNLEVPLNFSSTAPCHQPGEQPQRAYHISNPQTTEFCNKLDITDPIAFVVANDSRSHSSLLQNEVSDVYSSESQLGQLDITMNSTLLSESLNPDEISLDLDDEDESNNTSQSQKNAENPSSSQSGVRRRKLELPAPRSSFGDSTELDNEGEGETREDVNQDELKLLQSVFTSEPSSSDNNSASGGVNEAPSLESTDNLFVIDREGDNSNPKRRRNAAFYNLLE